MRAVTLTAIFLAAAISSAPATIIGFSSSPTGRSAIDASATILPDGDLFLVGTFSNPGAISLALGSVAAIEAAGGWSQFDGSQFTSNIFLTNHGKLTGQATDNNASASAFNLQNAYIIIFNSASAATATQMGIFQDPTATGGSSPNWVFPTNNGGVGDTVTLDMNDANVSAVGTVPVGSVTPTQFKLSSLVPEPSAIALTICGIFGLLGYRRLRRHG